MKCIVPVLIVGIIFAAGCSTTRHHAEADRVAAAERYFRGMYTCQPSVVDELAGEDIAVSYPIFTTVYHTPVIRGREAVKQFVTRFGSRWADARITFEDAVVEGNCVVLIWTCTARDVDSPGPGESPTNEEVTWGGITLIRFDDIGKIVAEIGEESAPGPMARLHTPDATE